jgi:hypothetical protein
MAASSLISILGDDHTTDDQTTDDDHHSGCGNQTSHSSDHGEEASIFGIGSHLNSSQLFLGFFIVSIILAFSGEGLNILEEFTKGTTYHLMLQRIYREIMMMGLLSFSLSLVLLAGVPFPHGLMIAFEFGDLTLFMTSIHFCLQGLWVMFVSIGLGNAWDRASKITTEELLIDVERSNDSSRLWKRMFYPFNVTRNQVEFRIFQSIFSSSYSISTKHTELDFGLFLKMTHENNLLHIIDFDITKWGLILILIGVAAIKVQLYHSSCTNPVCEAEEEIWIFTCCGVVILILSMLLFYWGRRSEMLLIQKSGVESIDDYPVFLMVESQMQIQFEKNVLKTSNVKSAINELMVEAESTKLEAESKKRKERRGSSKASAKIYPNFDGPSSATSGTKRNSFLGGLPALISPKESLSDSLAPSPKSHKYDIEAGTSEDIAPAAADQPDTTSAPPPSTQVPESRRNFNRGISGDGFLIAAEDEEDLEEKPSPKFLQDMEKSVTISDREVKKMFTDQPQQSLNSRNSNSVHSRGENRVTILPLGGDGDCQIHAAAHEMSSAYQQTDAEEKESSQHEGVPRRGKSINVNISASVHKAFGHILGAKSPAHPQIPLREDSVMERKTQFKAKMKTHVRKQNYRDVFLFENPALFYLLINIVMACNSLYLALWTTNFAIIANRGDSKGHAAMLVILSILPALFALPFVSQAIKSSSILKAVTKLNLDVVSAVVERTEARIKIIDDLREKLRHYLERESEVSVLRAGINWLYEQYNYESSCGLTRAEFMELLEGSGIHYTKQKCRIIFTALDINRDSFISMEVYPPPPPLPHISSLRRNSSGFYFPRRPWPMISRKGSSSMRRTARCWAAWASTLPPNEFYIFWIQRKLFKQSHNNSPPPPSLS